MNGTEVLPHSAYSPDIAPRDYHLFRSLQNSLAERQFENQVEVRKIVDNFVSSTDHAFFDVGSINCLISVGKE